jgi:hypothetical protein
LTEQPAGAERGTAGDADRPRTRTYALVLALEIAVLFALWAAGRHFGSL